MTVHTIYLRPVSGSTVEVVWIIGGPSIEISLSDQWWWPLAFLNHEWPAEQPYGVHDTAPSMGPSFSVGHSSLASLCIITLPRKVCGNRKRVKTKMVIVYSIAIGFDVDPWFLISL
ncbi:hypothetical protein BDV28DRAFT_144534, partial [Aspergillus coremiiformis]